MKNDNITKIIILNAVVFVAGSWAIGNACKVTKSALPLLAFILVPSWKFYISNETKSKED